MAVALFSRRPVARKGVFRRSVASVVAAALTAMAAPPTAAMAQSAQAATAAAPFCDNIINARPVFLAMAGAVQVEPGAGPVTISKASAILGGTMSKLDQMRSVQMPPRSTDANNLASTTHKMADTPDCAGSSWGSGTSAPSNFKDSILGAQSVSIARTPFDRDWAAVQMRPNNVRVQHAVAISGARQMTTKVQQVQAVNRWVNQNITFGEDQAVYHRADYWAPASETLGRKIGDCEDFAIAKMEMLAALGIPRADMRLIIARDLVRNADHAVLMVKLDGEQLMLDNATDRLLDGHLPNDYRPILSFSQNTKWVHGYDVQQPATLHFAVLPTLEVPALAPVGDVIAVTAELQLPVISVAWLTTPLALPTLL